MIPPTVARQGRSVSPNQILFLPTKMEQKLLMFVCCLFSTRRQKRSFEKLLLARRHVKKVMFLVGSVVQFSSIFSHYFLPTIHVVVSCHRPRVCVGVCLCVMIDLSCPVHRPLIGSYMTMMMILILIIGRSSTNSRDIGDQPRRPGIKILGRWRRHCCCHHHHHQPQPQRLVSNDPIPM